MGFQSKRHPSTSMLIVLVFISDGRPRDSNAHTLYSQRILYTHPVTMNHSIIIDVSDTSCRDVKEKDTLYALSNSSKRLGRWVIQNLVVPLWNCPAGDFGLTGRVVHVASQDT